MDYNVIENIKNGFFLSSKYDSKKMMNIPIPYVVVHANFLPNVLILSGHSVLGTLLASISPRSTTMLASDWCKILI